MYVQTPSHSRINPKRLATVIAGALLACPCLAAAGPARARPTRANDSDTTPALATRSRADSSPAQTAGVQPTPRVSSNGAPPANHANIETLHQIIVTGAPTFNGLTRLQAPFTVTTLTHEQIKRANAVSVADLMRQQPGVYPESSGGQNGANIEVAGYPTSNAAPFLTFELDGMPMFPLENGFADAIMRVDDTISNLEMVQGGPSLLYGNGQPGVTANFLLKQGTTVPHGNIGMTFLSQGGGRLDGFIGFPVGQSGWVGSVGGFLERSPGVRDPQFDAEHAGQLTATLSRDFNNGSVSFYIRRLNTHSQFVADTPLLNPRPGQFKEFPGFSILTGTFLSSADRYQTWQTSPCFTSGCTPGALNVNLSDGRGASITMGGGSLHLHFQGGWDFSNKFSLVTGWMPRWAIYGTGSNPQTLGSFITSEEQVRGVPTTLTPVISSARIGINTNSQIIVTSPNTRGLSHAKAASDQIRVSKKLFAGNTVTFGTYLAVVTDHDNAMNGNDMLLTAQSNPVPVSVNLLDGSTIYQLTDGQGIFKAPPNPSQTNNYRYNEKLAALFLSDNWTIGKWSFTGGGRIEQASIHGWTQNTAAGDLDDNPLTLYNNNAEYLASGVKRIQPYKKRRPSWYAGATYTITPNLSVFGSALAGIQFPSYESIEQIPSSPVQRVHDFEAGVKFANKYLFLSVAAYKRDFYGIPEVFLGDQGFITFDYGSRTKGVNVEGTVRPTHDLSIQTSVTYADGFYTHDPVCQSFVSVTGATECESIDGMRLARQPKFSYRVTPMYVFPTAWGSLRLWATYQFVGVHFSDQLEQQPLGQYHDVSVGAEAMLGHHWSLLLRGTNVLDNIGLTEGNARLFGAANTGDVILARSIEGREFNFQAEYRF